VCSTLSGVALRGLHHVQVNVTDLEGSLAFYRRLGMTSRRDRPPMRADGAWLDAGDRQLHLIVAAAPSDLGQHFALEVDDLDGVIASLRAEGVTVGEPRALGPGLPRQTSCHDPSGNRVELREPPG